MREASPQTNTSASFCNSVPHCVAVRRDRLLHIGLRLARLAGEGAHEFRHTRRLERAHLVLVEEVLHGIAAAEEEERLADRRALFLQRRALEQEAAERRDAGARPDHDHRQVRVLGRMEGNRRLADEARTAWRRPAARRDSSSRPRGTLPRPLSAGLSSTPTVMLQACRRRPAARRRSSNSAVSAAASYRERPRKAARRTDIRPEYRAPTCAARKPPCHSARHRRRAPRSALPFLLVLGVLRPGSRFARASRRPGVRSGWPRMPSSGTGSLTGRCVSALARGEIVA